MTDTLNKLSAFYQTTASLLLDVEQEQAKTYAYILVELCDQTTVSQITWYRGPFNRKAFDELLDFLHSEGFYYGEMIEAGYQVGESVECLVELVWVAPETQHGTGEGDVRTLPGYYDIQPLKLIDRVKEEQRK